MNSWLSLEDLEFGERENIISNRNFSREATVTGLQQHCTKKKKKKFLVTWETVKERYALPCLWSEHATQLLLFQGLLQCYLIINNTPSLLHELRFCSCFLSIVLKTRTYALRRLGKMICLFVFGMKCVCLSVYLQKCKCDMFSL